MPTVPFRQTPIRDLPRGTKADYKVEANRGLYVRVTADGLLRWSFRARIKNGGEHTKVFGAVRVLPDGKPMLRCGDGGGPVVGFTTCADGSGHCMECARKWTEARHIRCHEGIDPNQHDKKAEQEAEDARREEDRKNKTFGALWSVYSAADGELRSKGLRPGTIEDYERRWRLHVAPTFAGMAVKDVTPDDIGRFYRRRAQEGRSPDHDFAVLSGLCAASVRSGLISSNPCIGTKPRVKRDPVHKDTMTDAELMKLLRLAYDQSELHGLLAELAASTGMRVGEIHTMEWNRIVEDVGEEEVGATYTIPAALAKGRKTRDAYIPPQLWARLKVWRDRLGVTPVFGWVFPSARSLSGHTEAAKFVHEIAVEMGKPNFSFHSLRAHFATQAVNDGDVNIIELKDALGHKDIATTQKYIRDGARRQSSKDLAKRRATAMDAERASPATVVSLLSKPAT